MSIIKKLRLFATFFILFLLWLSVGDGPQFPTLQLAPPSLSAGVSESYKSTQEVFSSSGGYGSSTNFSGFGISGQSISGEGSSSNYSVFSGFVFPGLEDNEKTLVVASLNPNSGVLITVSPNDKNGDGNGTTPFSRLYNEGTTVNLSAPLTAGGNNFLKWQRNGEDWIFTRNTSVEMDANYTMTAVYDEEEVPVIPSSGGGGGGGGGVIGPLAVGISGLLGWLKKRKKTS